ncbi:hypothetical protein QAD02_004159 [Eretmocerus hayati]|uniref:Uncharacterized protein n=1 Tax=Eretmocerus hayati TaxID=131215 RepID=A0ACC2NPU9_9HYME|nr:hypothetical protein QAD02_004159 [Eretmocerus hayati]
MSVNNSNSHPEFDPNIRIKNEPDTAPDESPSQDSVPIPETVKPIKTEPGLPAANTTRLTSFRIPRDLTLGGNIKLERPKKLYTPNLNAQRLKDREDQNAVTKNEVSNKINRTHREKHRERNRDKNKGHSKAANNLVQSTGIFSEGLSNETHRRQSTGGGGGGGGGGLGSGGYRDRGSAGSGKESATLERPKLSIPQKVDKAEEAEKLRELLRDDFIDDGLDLETDNIPVALPLIEQGKLFKNELHNKLEFPSKSGENGHTATGQEDTHTLGKLQSATPHIKTKDSKVLLSVPQVIENKSSTFVLMQLPDCLPGLRTDEKQVDPKAKKSAQPSSENEKSELDKFCTLNNLKEGLLGKLQILRSGKARLVLGDNDLIVDVGSNLSFRQDLIAAKINGKETGNLINLGSVDNLLICSPDWESMLKNL